MPLHCKRLTSTTLDKELRLAPSCVLHWTRLLKENERLFEKVRTVCTWGVELLYIYWVNWQYIERSSQQKICLIKGTRLSHIIALMLCMKLLTKLPTRYRQLATFRRESEQIKELLMWSKMTDPNENLKFIPCRVDGAASHTPSPTCELGCHEIMELLKKFFSWGVWVANAARMHSTH